MIKKFLKNNINFFSLLFFIFGICFYTNVGGPAPLIFILIIPIIILLTTIDVIVNLNSSPLNFISILIISVFTECGYIIWVTNVKEDISIYLFWLILSLSILLLFNALKRKPILKYTTILVIVITVVIHTKMSSYYTFTHSILNKTGYRGVLYDYDESTAKVRDYKKYIIPEIYDELKYLSGDSCCDKIFRGVINGKATYINYLNKNIFPKSQEVEYIGTGGTYDYMFFKVKTNNKYGLFAYNTSICKKVPYNDVKQREKLNYNPIIEMVPSKYDEIEIIKNDTGWPGTVVQNEYRVPKNGELIIAVIAKNKNLHDIYYPKNSRSGEIKYNLYLKNQKNAKYIGKAKESMYRKEYLFEINGKVKNIEFDR